MTGRLEFRTRGLSGIGGVASPGGCEGDDSPCSLLCSTEPVVSLGPGVLVIVSSLAFW